MHNRKDVRFDGVVDVRKQIDQRGGNQTKKIKDDAPGSDDNCRGNREDVK